MKNPIESHFGNTRYHVSPTMAEKEKYLFYCCVPFQRWMLLPICSLVQLCFGSFYAWSIYNVPLATRLTTDTTPVTYADVSEVFYVNVGLFGLASCFAGPWIERMGPRIPCFLGSVLFFAGHLLSALGAHLKSLELVFLGYGVLAGMGIGIGYICPVAVLQKFYADKRGLAAGIAVGSFGLGSVVASFTQAALIKQTNVVMTFIIIGSLYFLLSGFFSLLLRFPPPPSHTSIMSQPTLSTSLPQTTTPLATNTTVNSHPTIAVNSHSTLTHHEPTVVSCVRTKNFLLLYLVFFTSVIPGLVMVSRVADMVVKAYYRTDDGTWVVGVNGFFNVLGRLFFGMLSDRLGRLPILMGSLVVQMISLGLMLHGILENQFYMFCATIWSLTACYGAALGLVPSLITDCFGNSMISALYGILLTAWAAGGVIGGIGFTKLIQSQKELSELLKYKICLYFLIPIAGISLILTMFFFWTLRKQAKKKALQKPLA